MANPAPISCAAVTDDHEPDTAGVADDLSGDPSAPALDPNASAFQRWRYYRSTRISKWDRPPAPRDWRFFVGGLGKVLIVTGLLMFGFVAYQLWGTGIETARAQNKLQDEFAEIVDSAPEPTATTLPTVTLAPSTTSPTSTQPVSTEPVSTQPASTLAGAPAPEATAPTSSVVPVEQEIPPIERGHALALLEIPKIGKTGDNALAVVPGVTLDDLKDGPGHYPDTPLPGQLGNSAIAGHRTTWGEPFRNIDKLEPGDEIIVTMLTGDRFVYVVASTEIVDPSDYDVVSTSDPNVAELTLTSCHPVYSARQRIVVHSFLKPEESDPVGVPTFYDLTPDDSEVTDTSSATSADDPTVTQPDASSSVADSSSDEGAAILDHPAADNPDDAFSEGWFHDPAAWPQIALWGAALLVIVIGVRKLSRRYRHDIVGITVGIVPFVICLYFFYQNVNRLLPPGL
jgi:sortase A